jgi:hypothetical protein
VSQLPRNLYFSSQADSDLGDYILFRPFNCSSKRWKRSVEVTRVDLDDKISLKDITLLSPAQTPF